MKKQSNSKRVKQNFFSDIKNHEMKILKDDGVYRHILFKIPNDGNHWFELITWPESLCITGDMGTYVFSRNHDMFQFFTDEKAQGISINPGYWAEKCQSHDDVNGVEEFSFDMFKRAVVSDFKQWVEDCFPSPPRDEESRKRINICWSEITDHVLSCDHNGYAAHNAANEFKSTESADGFEFVDFWEHDLDDYTYHYIWCLYAIVWGIQKYNSSKRQEQ